MEVFTVGSRVDHPRYGEGIISKVGLGSYEIFFAHGGKVDISKSNQDLTLIKGNESAISVNIDADELAKVIGAELDKRGIVALSNEIAAKWVGGNIIIESGNKEQQGKEIPIDTFFHKIVMVRDKLRVLEQNINSHNVLTDEDKVHLQQYITKAYGSLTTFNVLFADKDDYFVGAKK